MESKKKRNGLILSVLGVLGLVLITAGVTYAFFNYQKEGRTENVIRTGSLEFAYNEGNEVLEIQNALPMSDTDGTDDTKNPELFDFTITGENTSSQAISYYITARKLTGSTLDDNQVKVYLSTDATGTNSAETPVLYSDLTQTNNASFPDFIKSINYSSNGMDERVLFAGTVAKADGNYEKNFKFKMWLNGETSGNGSVADYSPYEFVRKSAVGATDQAYNTTNSCFIGNTESVGTYSDQSSCEAANGTWAPSTSLTIAQTSDTTAKNGQALITAGDLIKAVDYYALNAGAGSCSVAGNTTKAACTAASGTWTNGKADFERIAFVSTSDPKTILTESQAIALHKATVDPYGNYTYTALDGYTQTEQYYLIDGKGFSVKINVYANATINTN